MHIYLLYSTVTYFVHISWPSSASYDVWSVCASCMVTYHR